MDLANTGAPKPLQPTNSLPANGAADQPLTPTLVASPFAPGAGGAHFSSDWEIGTDSNMSTIVWSSLNNTSDLTQVTVSAGALQKSTRYYWRVRYINTEGGKSAYSTPTSFDTEIQLGMVKFLAAQNAMIKYLNPGSNWNGAVLSQLQIEGVSNSINPMVLFWFNLDLLQGYEANSDGKFRVNWNFVNENLGAQMFDCYLVTAGWNEATVTWDSFVGPGESDYTKPLATMFGSAEAIGYESSIWTIAETSIQEWLDNSQSNFGLAIYPQSPTPSAFAYSRRAGAALAPSLEFELLPEPAAAAAAAVMLAALLRRRMR
jgi:hypothetical protein